MAKIISLGNSQKSVFTMLVAIMLLEFGSLTKAQKIWSLAFTPPTQSASAQTTNSDASTVEIVPSTHPKVVQL